ncbi:MAG: PAS domain-containing protein, partial [Anaerolineae bacterium]|nr:PAS domain-containing protein [Anaerolineae bacterium]
MQTKRKFFWRLAAPHVVLVLAGTLIANYILVPNLLSGLDPAAAREISNDLQAFFWFAAAGAMTLSLWFSHRAARPLEILAAQLDAEDLLQPPLSSLEKSGEIDAISYALKNLAEQAEQSKAQIELESTRFSSILSQIKEGVVFLNQRGEIILINKVAADLFSLDPNSLLGKSLVRAFGYHQLTELWDSYKTSGEEQSAIIELSRQSKLIQTVLAPIGRPPAKNAIFLFQDLTELRRLETIRKDFISNLSHELRTPLASLKALAETLQMGALQDPSAADRFLSRMDTEIDALALLVAELTDLSKIESGQSMLEFS